MNTARMQLLSASTQGSEFFSQPPTPPLPKPETIFEETTSQGTTDQIENTLGLRQIPLGPRLDAVQPIVSTRTIVPATKGRRQSTVSDKNQALKETRRDSAERLRILQVLEANRQTAKRSTADLLEKIEALELKLIERHRQGEDDVIAMQFEVNAYKDHLSEIENECMFMKENAQKMVQERHEEKARHAERIRLMEENASALCTSISAGFEEVSRKTVQDVNGIVENNTQVLLQQIIGLLEDTFNNYGRHRQYMEQLKNKLQSLNAPN